MDYVVQAVGDDELPAGRSSVIVEREEGPPLLLVSGDIARCWAMMRAWEAEHEPCTVPTICRPASAALLRAV